MQMSAIVYCDYNAGKLSVNIAEFDCDAVLGGSKTKNVYF
jgi:hypothetical protein